MDPNILKIKELLRLSKFTDDGLTLLKHFEGCKLTAYPDPGTGAEPYTIGVGHTGGVKPGDVITEDQVDQLLLADLKKFEDGVCNLVNVELNPNQLSALVCFAFNVGLNNLKNSTLLKLVNAGDFDNVPDEFLKWNRAAGKVLAGLTARRQAEANLFQS